MGTSLFDRPNQSGPLPDAIAELLARLRESPQIGGHRLPAMQATAPAPAMAHTLPSVQTTAPATMRAHALPAMRASAGPMVSPNEMSVADMGQMPPMSLLSSGPPSGSAGPSAITSLLQMLTPAPSAPTQQGGPQGPQGPQGGGPQAPPMDAGPMGPPGPGAMNGVNVGGIPMPAPQAAPLPSMPQASSTSPSGPGMLDRIKTHLGSLLSAPIDAPQGYQGLLSPEEIAAEKPSRFAGFMGPSTKEQYIANLNRVLAMKQFTAGVTEHQRVMDARHEMATRFPLPQNPSIEDIRNNLAQQYSWAMSHGDEETVKDVGSRLSSIFAAPHVDPSKVVAPGGALVDSTGKPLYVSPAAVKAPVMGSKEWKDAEDFKAQLAARYRVDPTQLIQGADESGAMHWYRVPKNGGPPEMIEGMSPKVTIKSESATQELTRARAEAAVSEMNNGTKFMADYERRLASGEAKIGNVGQVLGSIANTFTHDDPASKIVQNTALSALNKTNPDLARYIRRALSFAEGESMVSSRPSDFRTRMSAFLSQAANGATPDMIDDIQSRRMSIMTPLNRIYSQAATEGSGKPAASTSRSAAPAGAKRSITKDQADFLKTKKGMSEADIAARYVVKP